jgi:site-specific DNA-methyltransferase (adenine-specific)
MQKLLQEDRIFWGKAPDFDNVPRKKIFNGERMEIIPKNIIDAKGGTRSAQRHLDFLVGEKSSFDNPKPVALIQHFLSIVNMKNDITVMDFFAGSGTTAEAVFNANLLDGGKRKCILIQKPEAIKSGKSRFSDISELCLERVRKITKNNVSELKLVVP